MILTAVWMYTYSHVFCITMQTNLIFLFNLCTFILLLLAFLLLFRAARPLSPKTLKFPRSMLIPKKGLIYDHIYVQRLFGSWDSWSHLIEPVNIEAKAKV